MKTQNEPLTNLNTATPITPLRALRLRGLVRTGTFLLMLVIFLSASRPTSAQQVEDPVRVLPEMFKIINDWGSTGPNPSHINGTLIYIFGQNMTNWLTGWDCDSGMVVWAWDPTNLCPGVEIYHTFTNHDANGNEIVWSGQYSGDYPSLWFEKRHYEDSSDDGTTRTWTFYLTDCSFRLLTGGPTNSNDKVLIELDVQVWDNCNGVLVDPTTYWITCCGMYYSLDTNGVAYLGCQDNTQYTFDLIGLPHIPYSGSNYDYSIYITPARHKPQAFVDANWDNTIETYGTNDLATVDRPFLFWANNDRDLYHYNDSVITGQYYEFDDMETGPIDYFYANIHNERDVEDFAQVKIQVPYVFINDGNWFVRVTGGALKFFPLPDSAASDTRSHVTDTNLATWLTQSANAPCLGDSSAGVYIPARYFTNGTYIGTFLFEAGSTGKFQVTVEVLYRGQVMADYKLWMDIVDVKSMYERWTVENMDRTTSPSQSYVPPTVATRDSAIAANVLPQLTSGTNYVLFVHGWNMEKWEKEAFAETAFKRLWWQGYRGRFGAFRWPTYCLNAGTAWSFLNNYDASEWNAWRSAIALTNLLYQLNDPSLCEGNVRLMAHSMGNVVAGEALNLLGTNATPIQQAKFVSSYIAMQGAIPAHCYDATAGSRVIPASLDDGTPNVYASYATTGVPYLTDSAGSGEYLNYFNQDDFALDKWKIGQNTKPDWSWGYFYSASHSPTGFYKVPYGAGSSPVLELTFPEDTYSIFAFAAEARCTALGATLGVTGAFDQPSEYDLQSWLNYARTHNFHSKQFRSTIGMQWQFWSRVKADFQLR